MVPQVGLQLVELLAKLLNGVASLLYLSLCEDDVVLKLFCVITVKEMNDDECVSRRAELESRGLHFLLLDLHLCCMFLKIRFLFRNLFLQ